MIAEKTEEEVNLKQGHLNVQKKRGIVKYNNNNYHNKRVEFNKYN